MEIQLQAELGRELSDNQYDARVQAGHLFIFMSLCGIPQDRIYVEFQMILFMLCGGEGGRLWTGKYQIFAAASPIAACKRCPALLLKLKVQVSASVTIDKFTCFLKNTAFLMWLALHSTAC